MFYSVAILPPLLHRVNYLFLPNKQTRINKASLFPYRQNNLTICTLEMRLITL